MFFQQCCGCCQIAFVVVVAFKKFVTFMVSPFEFEHFFGFNIMKITQQKTKLISIGLLTIEIKAVQKVGLKTFKSNSDNLKSS